MKHIMFRCNFHSTSVVLSVKHGSTLKITRTGVSDIQHRLCGNSHCEAGGVFPPKHPAITLTFDGGFILDIPLWLRAQAKSDEDPNQP